MGRRLKIPEVEQMMAARPEATMEEVLEEYAAAAKVPCFGPIPAGHRRDNVVLPLGGWVACRPEGPGRAHVTVGY